MQAITPALLAVLLFGFTACATKSYSFPDRDGLPPDVGALEQARQEMNKVPGKKDAGLGDVSWFPLIAMNAEIYNVSNPPGPKGTTYADFDAYGPLFMFVGGESYRYDQQQRLVQRTDESSVLWGLWSSERKDIRVPSGWYVDSETRLLFGLLRWPAEYYISSLPIDRLTPVVPAYSGQPGEGAGFDDFGTSGSAADKQDS